MRDKEEEDRIVQGKSSNHRADPTLVKNRVGRSIGQGEINME